MRWPRVLMASGEGNGGSAVVVVGVVCGVVVGGCGCGCCCRSCGCSCRFRPRFVKRLRLISRNWCMRFSCSVTLAALVVVIVLVVFEVAVVVVAEVVVVEVCEVVVVLLLVVELYLAWLLLASSFSLLQALLPCTLLVVGGDLTPRGWLVSVCAGAAEEVRMPEHFIHVDDVGDVPDKAIPVNEGVGESKNAAVVILVPCRLL